MGNISFASAGVISWIRIFLSLFRHKVSIKCLHFLGVLFTFYVNIEIILVQIITVYFG